MTEGPLLVQLQSIWFSYAPLRGELPVMAMRQQAWGGEAFRPALCLLSTKSMGHVPEVIQHVVMNFKFSVKVSDFCSDVEEKLLYPAGLWWRGG